MRSSRFSLVPPFILIAFVGLLVLFALTRYVDADEGIFLHAARLVQNGLTPYGDFFFMQMPYLAYLMAPVAGAGFNALIYGRLVCVALSVATAVVLFFTARRQGGDAAAAMVLFLFVFNGFVLTWHSAVKTLVFADFFALAGGALIALSFARPGGRRVLLLISGLCLGLAFNFRLTHMVLLPVAALVMMGSDRMEWKRVLVDWLMLGLGALLASTGSIALFLQDPASFYFHNVGFRQVWGFGTAHMPLSERLLVLGRFVVYPQNLLVFAILGGSIRHLIRRRKDLPRDAVHAAVLWCSFSAALVLLYLAVSPTALQYFTQILPFVLLGSVPLLSLLAKRWIWRKRIAVLGILYVIGLLPFVYVFIYAARPKDRVFELAHVREVVEVIQRNTAPGAAVLSFSPHLPVLADRPAVPGAEVRGAHVVPHLTEEQREMSRLFGEEEFRRLVARGEPAMVVQEPAYLPGLNTALETRYHRVDSTLGFVFYVRNGARAED